MQQTKTLQANNSVCIMNSRNFLWKVFTLNTPELVRPSSGSSFRFKPVLCREEKAMRIRRMKRYCEENEISVRKRTCFIRFSPEESEVRFLMK